MNILEYENYHEAKTHVELTFPYNTYLCSIPLDFSGVPLHWHDDMELIYIKKGCGHISVDFKEYHVTAPCFVLILQGQLHSIELYLDDGVRKYHIFPVDAASRKVRLFKGGFSYPSLSRQIHSSDGFYTGVSILRGCRGSNRCMR